MRITIVHNAITRDDSPDERDVLVQADFICQTLLALGHKVKIISCGLDLSDVLNRLKKADTEIAFNLVEAMEGHGRLIHLLPFLLDAMAIPYTGASAESLLMTSNKVLAKERMEKAGLPTPEWLGAYPESLPFRDKFNAAKNQSESWIVKSVWEHASIGLDDEGKVKALDSQSIFRIMKNRAGKLGGSCFAERFIEGREFNLSVLSGAKGPEVLPPAEILFDGYAPEKPRIVSYKAKWDESSYEYHHTSRSFLFENKDFELLEKLKTLAIQCWKIFGLRGYARIDFRVDPHGQPWILEVNANPCLSTDAGFAAAAQQAGISYGEAIKQIVQDAISQ
ncbi:MAG: ATP-grasp domain-containing protein [Desulfobacterales bacterium]